MSKQIISPNVQQKSSWLLQTLEGYSISTFTTMETLNRFA